MPSINPLPLGFAYTNVNAGLKRLALEVVTSQHIGTKSTSFTPKPSPGFSCEDPRSTPGKSSALPTDRPLRLSSSS